MRIKLIDFLSAIALVALLFAAVRSFLVPDWFGILLWPISLGFAFERFMGGTGLVGGTGAGVVSFAGTALVISSIKDSPSDH
jgi:hypothetical protein